MHVRGTERGVGDKVKRLGERGGGNRKGHNRGNENGSDRGEGQETVGGNDGK